MMPRVIQVLRYYATENSADYRVALDALRSLAEDGNEIARDTIRAIEKDRTP